MKQNRRSDIIKKYQISKSLAILLNKSLNSGKSPTFGNWQMYYNIQKKGDKTLG